MKFEEIKKIVKGVPFISENNAKLLYEFIIRNKLNNCLELGFAHGAASCYIAAALDELGEGKLVAVDLIEAENIFKPPIDELLNKANLTKYVEVHREVSGYNWFLHNEIVECSKNENKVCLPKYNLCIIDGPKNWTIDSSAFFLVDKLLKEKGWIIFDDYTWTYAYANKLRDATDGITHRSLSDAELHLPHIKEIFELLVLQHPSYSNFKIHEEGDWVWAQKIKLDTKKISYQYSISAKDLFIKSIMKIKERLI
jgi:predicted O-methyltransferase YrrM